MRPKGKKWRTHNQTGAQRKKMQEEMAKHDSVCLPIRCNITAAATCSGLVAYYY